jgi:hypothetical protein
MLMNNTENHNKENNNETQSTAALIHEDLVTNKGYEVVGTCEPAEAVCAD